MPASETRATLWLDSPRRASSPYVPDPLNNGQLTSPTYQYRYNDQGRMTELTDPLGRDTRFCFNDQGQQLSRTLPLGFGPDGKFGTVDDPVGWPHLADPNAPPASGLPFTERSRYDIKGRQTLHVSFEGVVTRFQYDDTPHGNGRLIEKQFFDNLTQYNTGMGAPSEQQTFTYDAFGRMISTVWDRELSAPGTEVETWTNSYDTQGQRNTGPSIC